MDGFLGDLGDKDDSVDDEIYEERKRIRARYDEVMNDDSVSDELKKELAEILREKDEFLAGRVPISRVLTCDGEGRILCYDPSAKSSPVVLASCADAYFIEGNFELVSIGVTREICNRWIVCELLTQYEQLPIYLIEPNEESYSLFTFGILPESASLVSYEEVMRTQYERLGS
jgi:hypothetical protein